MLSHCHYNPPLFRQRVNSPRIYTYHVADTLTYYNELSKLSGESCPLLYITVCFVRGWLRSQP